MEQAVIGIKENLAQFLLLTLINFFVGAMVGIERTILPLLGERQFGLVSASAALSFIISFGFSKAIVNYLAGQVTDQLNGRKKVLLIGWLAGLFVPVLIILARAWWVIILANVLLGINQGLAWSMTVNMKIDLSRTNQRGTAVGVNEFAGYSGVAIAAALSGFMASRYSLRPEPFYLGIGIAITGILISLIVEDTGEKLNRQRLENTFNNKAGSLSAREIFCLTSWQDKNLAGICFSGLATNLKDGMAWGLFPIYFATVGLNVKEIGTLAAVYPAAWGVFQLFTGVISDKWGRKKLITSGMWLQAAALWFILIADRYHLWIIGSALLGLGTAMVYPTLQAAVGDLVAPHRRASCMGVYRFWRDNGYALGALLSGILADSLGVAWAMGLVALLPFFAGVNANFFMSETLEKESGT
ncbi:MAG: MFS transporter [Peptococcaceae bacterium]